MRNGGVGRGVRAEQRYGGHDHQPERRCPFSARIHRCLPLRYHLRMTHRYLLPAIDLRGGQVVRLRQGDYDRQTTYDLDPVQQAAAFEAAGASWVHVVDLDGARDGVPSHLEVAASICRSTDLQVEYGGGVRDTATIDRLLEAGVCRVVLGTAALRQWDWFEQSVHDTRYRDHLVLGLDARGGKVALSGWEEQTDRSAVEIAADVSGWPLAAIVFTDIDTDGTLEGPNVSATLDMAKATRVPVVASGGVATLDDLRILRQIPVAAAIVGKAIYEGAFTVEEAVKVFENED